ncbi:MAG: hypothetical protein BRC25_02900 [Parcubacteria group bacterium SW_6_46_9]|nr:MAG: hypothetical protein BRC25_02900 [Parcubacteria group bacterium SW_6_46_9]
MKTPEQNRKEQDIESAETLDSTEKPTLKRPEEVEVEVKKRLEKTASVNEKVNDTENKFKDRHDLSDADIQETREQAGINERLSQLQDKISKTRQWVDKKITRAKDLFPASENTERGGQSSQEGESGPKIDSNTNEQQGEWNGDFWDRHDEEASTEDGRQQQTNEKQNQNETIGGNSSSPEYWYYDDGEKRELSHLLEQPAEEVDPLETSQAFNSIYSDIDYGQATADQIDKLNDIAEKHLAAVEQQGLESGWKEGALENFAKINSLEHEKGGIESRDDYDHAFGEDLMDKIQERVNNVPDNSQLASILLKLEGQFPQIHDDLQNVYKKRANYHMQATYMWTASNTVDESQLTDMSEDLLTEIENNPVEYMKDTLKRLRQSSDPEDPYKEDYRDAISDYEAATETNQNHQLLQARLLKQTGRNPSRQQKKG